VNGAGTGLIRITSNACTIPSGADTVLERVLRGGLTICSCGDRYHDDSAREPKASKDECGLELAKCGFRLARSSDTTSVLPAFANWIRFNFTELKKATALVARLAVVSRIAEAVLQGTTHKR